MATRYLLSVSAATLCFTIWFTGAHSFADVIAGRRSVAEVGLMSALSFTVFWVVAAMVSAAPCLMLAWIAKRMQIKALGFYLCAGVVIGLLAVLVHVELDNSISFYSDPPDKAPLDIWRGLAIFGLPLGFGGVVAGLVFWRLSCRCTGES